LKNLLNNTILKSLQDYKLTNRETKAVLYLPINQVQEFMKMNGGKLHKYKFETPEQRKAQRVAKILDNIVISSAFIGFCVLIYSYITY